MCNAADFGVAQIRHRLFIIATRIDLPEYSFPSPTHSKTRLICDQIAESYWAQRHIPVPKDMQECHRVQEADDAGLLPWVTVRDRTSGLPSPSSSQNETCNNHWHIGGARTYRGHTGSALDWPSKALKAGVHGVPGGENMFIRDDGSPQYLTLREMARIQSFPDSHYFPGSRSSVTRQIGNAVPCDLAAAIAMPLAALFNLPAPRVGAITQEQNGATI